jgi:hypothetical protein
MLNPTVGAKNPVNTNGSKNTEFPDALPAGMISAQTPVDAGGNYAVFPEWDNGRLHLPYNRMMTYPGRRCFVL